jgi:hypothetical protein
MAALWFYCDKEGYLIMNLKNIEFLIDSNGEISIGQIGPVRCAATASDPDQCLAMLVRRDGETLMELLTRLDCAIEDAYEHEIFADEING